MSAGELASRDVSAVRAAVLARRARIRSVVSFFALLFAFQSLARGDAPPKRRYVKFREVGVEMIKPRGFVVAEGFVGFAMDGKGASVMLASLAMSYRGFIKGNTDAALARKGALVDERRALKVDGQNAEFVRFRQQTPEGVFVRWALAIERGSHTKIIIGEAPVWFASELEKPIRSSLLSTRMIPEAKGPPEDLGFSLKPSKKLEFSPEPTFVGKRVVYRGEGPAQAPDTPVFMAGTPIDPPVEIDRRDFAMQRLTWIDHMHMKVILSVREIKIDGLDGVEVIAEAAPNNSSGPMVIYQVLLFRHDSTYYLLLGKVGHGLAKEYLPEFKAMAKSFRRAR